MKQIAKKTFAVIVIAALAIPTLGRAQNATKAAIEIQDNLFVTLTFHDVRDDVARTGD